NPLVLVGHVPPWLLDIDAERLGNAFVDVLAPASHAAQWADDGDGAVVEANRRIWNEQVGIERVASAEAVAVEAHAMRAVEAEQLRGRGLVALVAVRTGVVSGEDDVAQSQGFAALTLGLLLVIESYDDVAVGQIQRLLDCFRQPRARLRI